MSRGYGRLGGNEVDSYCLRDFWLYDVRVCGCV